MRRPLITRGRLAAVLAAATALGGGGAYAAALPVSSSSLWAGSQTLTKATCDLGSSAASDTWVNQARRSQTNGSSTTLSVERGNGSERDAFLTFSLASCGLPTTGGADTATLTLTVTSATRANHTISLYPVYSAWSASTLTWNAAQSLTVGSTATASFTTTTGTKTLTVTADVDAAIKAGVLDGWELVDTAGPGNATTTIASASYGLTSRRPSLSIADER